MESEMSKSSSLGSLTESDSAYGTESQYSSQSHGLNRVDSSDTLLTDTESESTSSSGPSVDFGTRGQHPSTRTIEVDTRRIHHHVDGDEDENHEQNVAFKVNKKTGDITVEIEDHKIHSKFSEESQSSSADREGVRVEHGLQDVGGATVDSVSHFEKHKSDSVSHRQDDGLQEKSSEVLTSSGERSKVLDQLVTSSGRYVSENANKQNEDTDICILDEQGTEKIINVKIDVSDDNRHTHDRAFRENVKEEEKDGNVVRRASNVDYETTNSDQTSHSERKEQTDDDKHIVSEKMDKSENFAKEKSKQLSSSEISDDGTLRQSRSSADRKDNKTSHKSSSTRTQSSTDGKGKTIMDQVTSSQSDLSTSKDHLRSHCVEAIDPSGLKKQSGEQQQIVHECLVKKSERESKFSSLSPDGTSGGKSTFKSKMQQSGHQKHETKSSSSSMSKNTATFGAKEQANSIKPILHRLREKRPLNPDGSPKFPKKVHFDSTVAVQDLGEEMPYTQKLAAEGLGIGAATCIPQGAAPLCTMTELESFDAEILETDKPGGINKQSDISMNTNKHNEREVKQNSGNTLITVGPPRSNLGQNTGSHINPMTTDAPCLRDSLNPEHGLSKPRHMTPLDSLSQLTSRLTPSVQNPFRKELPPGECQHRLLLSSQEDGTRGITPEVYQVCVPVQAVDPPPGTVSRPARSVTAPSTSPGSIDHDGGKGGGSGVSQRHTLGSSPTNRIHITQKPPDPHLVHDKWGHSGRSEDNLPPKASQSLSQEPQDHGQDQILEQHDAIGQAKKSGLSATQCLPVSPKPGCPLTPAKHTQSKSGPLFSKLTNTGLGATASYKAAKLLNNNNRESDPEGSVETDPRSLLVPSQPHSDNGSPKCDHVASGVQRDLVHREVLVQSSHSDSTNGLCSGSVCHGGLGDGLRLDSGLVGVCAVPTCSQHSVGDHHHGINQDTILDHSVRKHPGKLRQNARCDKNTVHFDGQDNVRDTGISSGDCDPGRSVPGVSRILATAQQTSAHGGNTQTGNSTNDILTVHTEHSVTSMESGESGSEDGEIPQPSATSHDPRGPTADSSSTGVCDSDSPDLSLVSPLESSSSETNMADSVDQVSSQENIDPEDSKQTEDGSTDSEVQKSMLNDSRDLLSLGDSDMDKTQTAEEGACNSTAQADINRSEMAEASLNNENAAVDIAEKCSDIKVLAPLACEEDESDDDESSEIAGEEGDEQEMDVTEVQLDDRDGTTPEPGLMTEQMDNDSDAEMTCLDDIGAEGQWDSCAETDFTEDSEQTFVMNTDVDDDILDSLLEEPSTAKDEPASSNVPAQGDSIADKLKMISQSGVLSGRVSLKTMLDQRQKCDVVQVQDLSPIIEDPSCPIKLHPAVPVSNSDKNVINSEPIGEQSSTGQLEKPFEVVTLEMPITTEVTSQDVKSVKPQDQLITKLYSGAILPVATVQSQSMVAILDVVGVEEEMDMSTLERKRKRAKSEEKTASSRGVYAETELSQQDVDDAVKKLRQGSEDNLRIQPGSYHSQYPRSGQRRYDWNTHHFFPDIHDFDVTTLVTRRRSHDSIYSQYIEEEWLQQFDNDTEMKNTTMDNEQTIDLENQENFASQSREAVGMESDGSSSSDENDSPKVWRKNPLLVRRKKKSERRLSAEIRFSAGDADPETPDVGVQPGFDSPGLRRREGSPRCRRSPRRSSNPNQNKIPRRNSDIIQEKVEKFQELQRRRKALDSTSEESLVQPKKQGRKVGHRHSDLGGYVKDGQVFELKGRAHSQEDIRYESQGQSLRIQSDVLHRPEHVNDTKTSPRLYQPYQPSKKPGDKSQYDFRSFKVDHDRNIHQHDFYAPDQDKREPLVDYRNISSSFENIYDAVDLSMYSPSMDVGQEMNRNMAEARRRYKLYKMQQMEQTGPSVVQVNIDARQLPARITVDPVHAGDISIPHSATQSKDQSHVMPQRQRDLARLNIRNVEHSSEWADSSQPGTPTSPVWYVPKPHQQYDIPVSEPEQRKMLDAKSLIEEEKKKFIDYKREYVRRLSERDSTSGTSGDEQRKDADGRHRVIPPDDYEYILRKIHHKRQDAYYAESTSQYGPHQDQPSRSEAEHLKYNILAKKQHHQQPSPTNILSEGVQSPTKTYLDSLNLPGVQHERSTSQLSTESSRELEQYFVVGKQRHPNVPHSLPSGKADEPQEVLHSQQFQHHPEEQRDTPTLDYKDRGPISTNTQQLQAGKLLEPMKSRPQSAEPHLIRQHSMATVTPEINQDKEQLLSVQDKMKAFEQMNQRPSNLVRSASDRPGQYLHSKPPMPKREDFTPAKPSNWSYNTTYSSDKITPPSYENPSRDDGSQPWVGQKQEGLPVTAQLDYNKQPLTDETRQPEKHSPAQVPPKEKYGLVLRLTPQGAVASISPSLDGQTPTQPEQVQFRDKGNQRQQRPLSSSILDYNPDRRVYESGQVPGDRFRHSYMDDQHRPSVPDDGPRDWRSQEDFQKLKDGQQFQEKHATPYQGQNLGRDLSGPSKTPPVNQPGPQNGMISPSSQLDPRQQFGDSSHGHPAHQSPPGPYGYPAQRLSPRSSNDAQEISPSRDQHIHQPHSPSELQREQHAHQANSPRELQQEQLVHHSSLQRETQRDKLLLGQFRQEMLQSPDKDRSRSPQKSWSTRINEVESMRPTTHQDLPERPFEVSRSFAIVAINDKGKDKGGSLKVPFKTYDEKVQQYCHEQQDQSNSKELPNQSTATSQYEEHVKKSQEKYRAQKHATMESSSDRPIYPPGINKTEYVDPTLIRQRKTSSDSNQSSSLHNIQLTNRGSTGQQKGPLERPVGAESSRSYGLQIQVEKGERNKLASEICVKLSLSREDLTKEPPNVSVSTIKDRLLSANGDKGSEASFKQELEKVWERHDRKVSAIQTEVFSSKEAAVPSYRSYSTSSIHGCEEDQDERLLNYASYKDGQARKRSNIYDVLTDLERTYEQLDLDNENLLNGAERREYVSHILSNPPPHPPDVVSMEKKYLIPENTEPNVKRLSITNLKKLEDLQKEQDSNPSLEYAKRWLEEDKGRVVPTDQTDAVFDAPVIPAPPPSESDPSVCKLSSLPRKVKDDMAYRRQRAAAGSLSSQPNLPASTTMSYLAKSPTLSPAQSMESLGRKSSRQPDPARDDLMYRNMQRAKSPATPDRELAALKSPTSTDYLNERTTEPARGRMRLHPEKHADKYHDDLAYRKLRKDVTPVVAELPDAYYKMKGFDGKLRHRSLSLERVTGERRSREVKRNSQPLERCQSLGPTQRISTERRPSLSKGISCMVDYYSQPIGYTQSAPDLTEQSIFADSYNNQGDLVSDDPRYSKYAHKHKKQQTPRTVKLRHEMKSKMRQLKHSADSGYMEQSESDASHSSSGPENRSPPDGNFDSDDHDLRISDTSSDKEIMKGIANFKTQYATTTIPVDHVNSPDTTKAVSSDVLSQIKFIDDAVEQNGNNNNNKTRMTKSATTLLPTQELPHHTFVFKLPEHNHGQQAKQHPYPNWQQQSKRLSPQQPDKQKEIFQQQPRYHPQFSAPNKQSPTQSEQGKKQIYTEPNKPHVAYSKDHPTEGYPRLQQTQPYPVHYQQNQYQQPFKGDDQQIYHKQQPKSNSPTNSQLPGRLQEKFQQKQMYDSCIVSEQSQRQQHKASPPFLHDIPAAASQFHARNRMPTDLLHTGDQQLSMRYSQDSGKQQIAPRQVSQAYYQQQDYQQRQEKHPKGTQHYHQPSQQCQEQGQRSYPQLQQHQQPLQQQQQQQQQPQQQSLYHQQQTHNLQQQTQDHHKQPQHHQQHSQYPDGRSDAHTYSQQKSPSVVSPQQWHPSDPPHSQKQTYPQQTREQFFQLDKPHQAVSPTDQRKSTDKDRTCHTRPAPPARVSSLIHDPCDEAQSDGQRSVNLRPGTRQQSWLADRTSWHGPIDSMSSKYAHAPQTSTQKVEIIQPATIETCSTEDMDRHIRAMDRRSWHEHQISDDNQVKVEFAFKAPNGTQLQKHVPRQDQVQKIPPFNAKSEVPDIVSQPQTAVKDSPSTPATQQMRQTTKLESQPGTPQSPPQPTYTAPLMQARSQQQTSQQPKLIKPSTEASKAKFELPVIHSQPKNAGVTPSRTDISSDTPKPSYTVEPIIKKVGLGHAPSSEQKKDEGYRKMDVAKPISGSSVSVTSTVKTKAISKMPVTTSSELVTPKSPKSQHIQLQDVTRIIRDPSGNKPPSQLRTTQIEVVTSTILPAETSKDKDTTEQKKVSSHLMKHISNSQSKDEVPISQKSVSSHQERSMKSGVVPLRMPVKGLPSSPAASLLSPPLAPNPLQKSKLSPAERGFLLSPPPRRAGLDHFELSDGEMTDATDITLDGLVRSNLYRPSSPETLDFSDFVDNMSETGSDSSQKEQTRALFLTKFRDKKIIRTSSSQSQQQIRQTSLSSTRTVTTKQSSRSQEIVTSTKVLPKVEDEPEPNFSFKDLVKSFEAKTNPFMRIAREPQRSASTEELPREVASHRAAARKTPQDLKQISGSDPNLFKGERRSPSWRRL